VQKKIDAAWLTAALFNTMVDEQCESMAGLSQLLTGGERESVGHLRRFKRRCPEVRLIHGYGPTENTTFSLCHTITNDDLESDRVPISRPIHGSIARIVEPGGTPDETHGRIDKGELLVGGDGLALGYLGRDDLTAERFVFDSDGTRWYRTGDLVERLPDGSIRFVGRIDRQVKIRGHRIELDEVETVLSRCPGVLHAAVIVEGDDAATRRLVGAVILEDEVPIDSVRKYLSEHIPRPMIPDRLVHLQEMARGSTGKIDRAALRAVLAQTEEESSSGAAGVEPAQTPTERKFLELLAARLARSGPEGIGRRADFYEIGGHSLIAMRLATDIEGSLGVRIRPVDILTIRRVDLIAAHIDQLAAEDLSLESDGADPPELIDPIGDIRTRVLIESERDPTGRAMLVHQAWLVKPGLDIERVRALWQTILARHESLRCAFSFDGQTPELLMLDPAGVPWLHAEPALRTAGTQVQSGLPREVIDAIGARIRADEMPVRVHHWAMADDCSLIAVVYHHAVVDEWALELIEAELAGLLAGERLPAQIEQYDQFVRLEQAWRDESAAEAIAQRLAGTDEGSVELPMAGPQAGLVEKIELDGDDEALARSIDDASARLGVLPAALLLGVFGQTLV
ncbi:MAG: AMP-binding protein, partial [Phycisphaerales bacterium]